MIEQEEWLGNNLAQSFLADRAGHICTKKQIYRVPKIMKWMSLHVRHWQRLTRPLKQTGSNTILVDVWTLKVGYCYCLTLYILYVIHFSICIHFTLSHCSLSTWIKLLLIDNLSIQQRSEIHNASREFQVGQMVQKQKRPVRRSC